jgi:hypothetical protein
MITIPELVEYSNNLYSRTDEQCDTCQNPNCAGRCSRCFNAIHGFHSTRDYDCINLIYHYVCEYIYAKSSEIYHLFNRHLELRALDHYRILSIGCGPASELFGISDAIPESLIDYKGYDLNPFWGGIHTTISNSALYDLNRNIEFYCSNVFEEYGTLDFTPNVLVLSYLISHLPKAGIVVNDFLLNLERIIIDSMPNNSFIILNDTNHRTVRDNFEVLLNNLNKRGRARYIATRYRFDGYTYEGSIRHQNDNIIYPIPQTIRDRFDTWRECGKTAQIVINKILV